MIYFIILLLFVPTAATLSITPYITRKTESFGVSIPEEIYSTAELVQLRKKYTTRMIIFGIIILAVSFICGSQFDEQRSMMIFLSLFFVYSFGSYYFYYQGHKTMKALKHEHQWQQSKIETTVVDTSFRKNRLIYSHMWFLPALMITIITFAITVMNYDRFPNEIPMQYGFDGEVTRWATKSFGSVFGMPLIQLFLIGLFIFLNYTISMSRQQIDPSNPDQSIKQNVIFRRRWSAFMIWTGTALIMLFFFNQLSLIYPINMKVLSIISFILTGVIVLAAVILAIITGQGGSRINIGEGKNGELVNRDEDRFWKLGIFYYNPSDPAVWVEKRFGVGWTINLARPHGWIFLIIIIAVPIIIGYL